MKKIISFALASLFLIVSLLLLSCSNQSGTPSVAPQSPSTVPSVSETPTSTPTPTPTPIPSESVLPCKHQYEKTVLAPTCTEEGYTTYLCKICQNSYNTIQFSPPAITMRL